MKADIKKHQLREYEDGAKLRIEFAQGECREPSPQATQTRNRDIMTLQEWSNEFTLPVFTLPTHSHSKDDAARYVDARLGTKSHAMLFSLDDYCVSSVTAGSVWLVPMSVEAIEQNEHLLDIDIRREADADERTLDALAYTRKDGASCK